MSENLASHETLWGRFLGKKYNRMSETERNLPNLVTEFYHRRDRDRLIDEWFGSKHEFINELESSHFQNAEQILLSVWARAEWERQSRGEKFKIKGDIIDELDRIDQSDDYLVRTLRRETAVVWELKSIRRDLRNTDDGEVENRALQEAKPIFVVFDEEESTLEFRGARRRLNRLVSFFEEGDVNRFTPDLTDESIIEGLTSIFSTNIETLQITGVSFRTSNLPNGSGIKIRNDEGVQSDLKSDALRPDIIDQANLSELEEITFKHESDTQIKLRIERGQGGFYFDLQDSNLTETQKTNVESVLRDKLGISLDRIYRYDKQHHNKHIVHQLLTGDRHSYQEYYGEIDDDTRAFVDRFLSIEGTYTFQCFRCGETFDLPNAGESPTCPKCGQTLFKGGPDEEISIDRDAVISAVKEKAEEMPGDIKVSEDTRLLDIQMEMKPENNPQYLASSFQLTETAGTAIDSHRYEFWLYPVGNGRLSPKISQYLKQCVPIVYGQAYLRGYERFGNIDLFEFLTADNPGQLFAEQAIESNRLMRGRVQEKAEEARERLGTLIDQVEEGIIEETSKEKLTKEYDYDDFERDVFYLLKSMFLYTERWGRDFEAEADGCLVVPKSKNDYYVATFDPKLTYDIRGYDLDSGEKSKAAYYILSESRDNYISNTLKDGGTIDGHIFVSDIFREGQYSPVAEKVNEWFSLVENRNDSLEIPVIFLHLRTLTGLYDIVADRFDLLYEYPELQKTFRKAVIDQLTEAKNGYIVLHEDGLNEIRKVLLQKSREVRHKQSVERL